MPALIIVLAHLGIPLTHGITHPRTGIIPSAAAYLQRHLRLELHVEDHGSPRHYRLGEIHLQDGLLHVERLGYAIYRKRDYFLIADLLRRKVLNTISYTRVPVLVPVTVPAHIGYFAQLTAMHIHHTAGLKSIPVQVVEHLP